MKIDNKELTGFLKENNFDICYDVIANTTTNLLRIYKDTTFNEICPQVKAQFIKLVNEEFRNKNNG